MTSLSIYKRFFKEAMKTVMVPDNSCVEEYENPLQDSFDSLNFFLEEQCSTHRFKKSDEEGFNFDVADMESVKDRILSEKDKRSKYGLKNDSFCIFKTYMRHEELWVEFCLIMECNVVEDTVRTTVRFYNCNHKEYSVSAELENWESIKEYILYCFNLNYNELSVQLKQLELENRKLEKRHKLDSGLFKAFIINECRNRNLEYCFRMGRNVHKVSIKLPHRLCLEFCIKDGDFMSEKNMIPSLIDDSLDFVNRHQIRGNIKFYSTSDIWSQ